MTETQIGQEKETSFRVATPRVYAMINTQAPLGLKLDL